MSTKLDRIFILTKLLISSFMICISFPLKAKEIQIIAHRGASKEAPENTIKAFEKAIELNADYIEFDVHLSEKKVPIVIHNLELAIEKEKHLPKLLNTLKGEKIPTLKEVLELKNLHSGLMIEIKEGSSPPNVLCDNILRVVLDHPPKAPFFLASSSLRILSYIQNKAPQIPLIAICEPWDNIEDFLQLKLDCLAICHIKINRNVVSYLHAKKIKVWAWTVDTIKVADQLVQFGVDGIITNDVRGMCSYLYCNN